jgi:signal transduction histidine kinase
VSHTVVLVDDMPELRKFLRLILEHAGPFEIVGEGCDGNEAAALVAEHQPDLLVMDVEMRGGPSGWEVLPRIRETAPNTAVVILSGSAADPLQGQRAVLADAVLEKGLAPAELNDALLAVLRTPPSERRSAARQDDAGVEASATTATPAMPTGSDDAPSSEVEELRREVQRLADELAGFASVASHDLAQPLQVAYGYLEMVRSEFAEGMDETAVAWIDNAITSLERMRQLVQDILSFARSGNRDVTPEPVAVERAAVAAQAELEATIQERGAEIRIGGDLPTVLANEDHLRTVLEHLLANALRFVPADRAPVVDVVARDGGSEWIIDVSDNGPGIEPAVRGKVFDLFSRGPKSTNSGTGLGLAVCRKLLARTGGRIWVEDRADGAPGASVRFALPKGGAGAAPLA